jgi:hypothetical protein
MSVHSVLRSFGLCQDEEMDVEDEMDILKALGSKTPPANLAPPDRKPVDGPGKKSLRGSIESDTSSEV